MGIGHLLEDFAASSPGVTREIQLSGEEFETRRLQAYEDGYKAGWDDASRAQSDDQARISADLAQNLQEMSFTFLEAHAHLSQGLRPLLTRLVETVLPQAARHSLAPMIVEELEKIARQNQGAHAEIVVSPEDRDAVTALIGDDPGFPLEIVAEPTLGQGQAHLRFGQAERAMDLDAALDGISHALDAFFHETERELAHG